LKLDLALQLLRQSGHELPEGDAANPAWLQSLIDSLVDMSSRDALTGLANRRSFELALAREIDRVARAGEPALLLALDIDHFKRVNDTHGHASGDLVLKAVAAALLAWKPVTRRRPERLDPLSTRINRQTESPQPEDRTATRDD